jgi:hypothetical protein
MNDQPTSSTPECGRKRRGQRAGAIDEQADGVGAACAPLVAQLAAEQHEGRHDQGVDGDRRLQPTTVVFRSSTICEIETFMTVVSSTMMNCAAASIAITPHPAPFFLRLPLLAVFTAIE